MEQANIFGVMELFTRVILSMIRCQERELGYQNMEISIKANITREKDMGMAGTRKEMGKFWKENLTKEIWSKELVKESCRQIRN